MMTYDEQIDRLKELGWMYDASAHGWRLDPNRPERVKHYVKSLFDKESKRPVLLDHLRDILERDYYARTGEHLKEEQTIIRNPDANCGNCPYGERRALFNGYDIRCEWGPCIEPRYHTGFCWQHPKARASGLTP